MRKQYRLPVLFFLGITLVLSGCTSTSRLNLSKNLESDTQLQVEALEQESISFQFEGHPDAKNVEVSNGPVAQTYSMNSVLEERLKQLVRYKFESIDSSAENKVTFTIDRFEASTDNQLTGSGGTHSITAELSVEVQNGEESSTRTIERSTNLNFEQVGDGMSASLELDKSGMNEYVRQFVLGANAFMDTSFDVD
jgi:hypothetical protein